jgi:hypothetical protein
VRRAPLGGGGGRWGVGERRMVIHHRSPSLTASHHACRYVEEIHRTTQAGRNMYLSLHELCSLAHRPGTPMEPFCAVGHRWDKLGAFLAASAAKVSDRNGPGPARGGGGIGEGCTNLPRRAMRRWRLPRQVQVLEAGVPRPVRRCRRAAPAIAVRPLREPWVAGPQVAAAAPRSSWCTSTTTGTWRLSHMPQPRATGAATLCAAVTRLAPTAAPLHWRWTLYPPMC